MKKAGGIFTVRNWERFCLYLNNQGSHEQTDGTGGFRVSNWSKTNSPSSSDCRLVMLYGVVKKPWTDFLPSEFGTPLLLAQELQELCTN